MSEEKALSTIVTFGVDHSPVRVVFPNLFKPKAIKDRKGNERGDPKYSATFLFDEDHPDLEVLKKAAIELIKSKHPGRKLSEFQYPFKSGDDEAEKAAKRGKDGSFYEGKVVLKARSKFAPAVVDGRQNPPRTTTNENLVYGGCYVAAEVNLVYFDAVQEGDKDGVAAYLNSVCFVSDGPKIGRDATAAFRGLVGKSTSVNPAGDDDDTDDDEIPF